MVDAPPNEMILDAEKAFESGSLHEAEELLLSLPQDDLKVRHNLAVVRYLQGSISPEAALAQLSGDISSVTSAPGEESSARATNEATATVTEDDDISEDKPLTLRFEGYEISVYNRAVIYARCGQTHKSLMLLRSLLKLTGQTAPAVLVNTVCLFHTLTRSAVSLGMQPRSKEDEELIKTTLNDVIKNNTIDSAHVQLIAAAFADSSNLHEVFKASSTPEEQGLYLNNLGVLSLYDSKMGVAALCFTRAQSSAPKPLRQRIMYNNGLSNLLRGDYEAALEYFSALTDMDQSALYWLRVAECRLGLLERAHQQAMLDEYERSQNEYNNFLSAGKTFVNFEYMVLPGTTAAASGTGLSGLNKEAVTSGVGARSGNGDPAVLQLERSAAAAVQNALYQLIPAGQDFAAALKAYPHNETLLQYAMLYWVALELRRQNYVVAVQVGQQLLKSQELNPLPPTVYATLLCYLVECLVHLNNPEQAMNVLRSAALSHLVTGASHEFVDKAQRSRVEAVFIKLAITHILTGSWQRAHVVVDSLLQKLYETMPQGATEYKPERDTMFAYQLLNIFLELAQGNQEKAGEWLSKITWSI